MIAICFVLGAAAKQVQISKVYLFLLVYVLKASSLLILMKMFVTTMV